jgi:DNA-directed RNA polymerase specialized sigma24 family protein
MKYIYTNATGTEEIEVDEQFYDLLVAMDNDEYNGIRRFIRNNPISLENCEYEGEWFRDKRNFAAEIESDITVEEAMRTLTAQQRICFTEVCIKGRREVDVGDDLGLTHQAVSNHIRAAKKKLKKYFEG